jgi:hypothetical protein
VAGQLAHAQVHRADGGPVADAHAIATMGDATSSTAPSNPPRSAHSHRHRRGRRQPGGHRHSRIHQAADHQHGQAPQSQSVGHDSNLPTRQYENADGQTMPPSSSRGVPKACPGACRQRAFSVSTENAGVSDVTNSQLVLVLDRGFRPSGVGWRRRRGGPEGCIVSDSATSLSGRASCRCT